MAQKEWDKKNGTNEKKKAKSVTDIVKSDTASHTQESQNRKSLS